MTDEIEILKSIYCRPNEILYDHLSEIVIYNAFDDNLQTTAFTVKVYLNNMLINIDSKILTNDELKQLQTNACLITNLYDLFVRLKNIYDELIMNRTIVENKDSKDDESSSIFLMKIDHMRSPSIYMKNLRQWTNELNITGRVLIIPHEIFILIEGKTDQLKKFVVKLKTETVDIDSRGRPCKERLLTQIVELTNHLSKFNTFDNIQFSHRNDLFSYLESFHYENLVDYINH